MKQQEEIDFKLLFEEVPGKALVLSSDLIILAANKAFLNSTFSRRELLVGNFFFDVFQENLNNSDSGLASLYQGSLQYVIQHKSIHILPIHRYHLRNKKGVFEEKYWRTTNKPILSSENEIRYIIHSVEDLTELVQLKKKYFASGDVAPNELEKLLYSEIELLHTSKELEKVNEQLLQKVKEFTLESQNLSKDIFDYKVALDAADIVAITDHKGIIQYANDNFCKISKYSKEELIGQNHRILNSGYHSTQFFKKLWQTISKGIIWKGVIKNKAKDGTFYWVDTTIVPFLNNKGKPHKYLAIRSDITEQKQILEDLKRSEDRYRDIFSNALVAIFTTDVNKNKITDVNNCAVSLFGYASKEDFLTNFTFLSHRVERNEQEKKWVELVEKGESNRIEQFKKKDGRLFWVNIFTKLSQNNSVAHTILLDVTEQIAFRDELESKVAERTLALTESLSREKQLNEMKSNFLSIASHEFRTPLGTILSSASLIKKYVLNSQQTHRIKHVERITNAVNHLTIILNDFLTLEKLRKGYVDFEVEEFILTDLIKESIQEIKTVAKNNNQKIRYSHSGEKFVKQVPKIMKNILLNLLSNACKYSENGMEIKIRSFVDESSFTIRIHDHGIGIPIQDQGKLFTEFYRAKNAKNIQGTGLGLSIVKNYVALLKGTIRFDSELNKGTVFTLTFPRDLEQTS